MIIFAIICLFYTYFCSISFLSAPPPGSLPLGFFGFVRSLLECLWQSSTLEQGREQTAKRKNRLRKLKRPQLHVPPAPSIRPSTSTGTSTSTSITQRDSLASTQHTAHAMSSYIMLTPTSSDGAAKPPPSVPASDLVARKWAATKRKSHHRELKEHMARTASHKEPDPEDDDLDLDPTDTDRSSEIGDADDSPGSDDDDMDAEAFGTFPTYVCELHDPKPILIGACACCEVLDGQMVYTGYSDVNMRVYSFALCMDDNLQRSTLSTTAWTLRRSNRRRRRRIATAAAVARRRRRCATWARTQTRSSSTRSRLARRRRSSSARPPRCSRSTRHCPRTPRSPSNCASSRPTTSATACSGTFKRAPGWLSVYHRRRTHFVHVYLPTDRSSDYTRRQPSSRRR